MSERAAIRTSKKECVECWSKRIKETEVGTDWDLAEKSYKSGLTKPNMEESDRSEYHDGCNRIRRRWRRRHQRHPSRAAGNRLWRRDRVSAGNLSLRNLVSARRHCIGTRTGGGSPFAAAAESTATARRFTICPQHRSAHTKRFHGGRDR